MAKVKETSFFKKTLVVIMILFILLMGYSIYISYNLNTTIGDLNKEIQSVKKETKKLSSDIKFYKDLAESSDSAKVQAARVSLHKLDSLSNELHKSDSMVNALESDTESTKKLLLAEKKKNEALRAKNEELILEIQKIISTPHPSTVYNDLLYVASVSGINTFSDAPTNKAGSTPTNEASRVRRISFNYTLNREKKTDETLEIKLYLNDSLQKAAIFIDDTKTGKAFSTDTQFPTNTLIKGKYQIRFIYSQKLHNYENITLKVCELELK
jgi:cell division protein FtsB